MGIRKSLAEHNESASILAALTLDLSNALNNIDAELCHKGIDYLEKVYINHDTKMIYVTFFQLEHQGSCDVNEILNSNLSPLGFKHDNRKKFSLKYLKE